MKRAGLAAGLNPVGAVRHGVRFFRAPLVEAEPVGDRAALEARALERVWIVPTGLRWMRRRAFAVVSGSSGGATGLRFGTALSRA